MGIAGLNLKFNKKVKTNVEREKSSDRATVSKKLSSVMTNCKDWIHNYKYFVEIYK